MKQVFITNNNRVVVENVPAPACPAKGLLVETRYSLISTGTEVGVLKSAAKATLIDNLQARSKLVMKGVRKLARDGVRRTWRAVEAQDAVADTPGYSLAGRVLEVGVDVTEFAAGDWVACAGTGHASHAEVVAVPVNLAVRIPERVAPDQAAFATVGAIAMQGVRRAEIRLGETVVVIGLGLIGLMAVQLARASGARVLGIEPSAPRRDLAEKLGAEAVFAPGETAERDVAAFTGGFGADAVLLCAASAGSEPANAALRMTRQRGKVVFVGGVGLDLDREPFYKKDLDLHIGSSYGPGRYDPAFEERGIDYPYGYVRWTERRNLSAVLDLIRDGRLEVGPLTSECVPVLRAADAFETLAKGDPATVGVLLDYGDTGVETERKLSRSQTASAGRIHFVRGPRVGVALVGAGGFGRSVYLPIVDDLPGAQLRAIVTGHGHNAQTLAKLYHADIAASDIEVVLKDDRIDAVLIATRNHQHENMAIRALEAGKHVLVEKPMAVTRAGVDAVLAAAEAAEGVFSVGHNRRYAQTGEALKQALAGRVGPLAAVYRINAGSSPPDHWMHVPGEGGGRIVSEVCHFFDFLRFLVGGPAIAIQAAGFPVDGRRVRRREDVAATLRFADGSVGQVLYVATGHEELEKERLEVFWDGKAAVLEDFKNLTIHGMDIESIVGEQDKGWRAQLERFFRAVRGEPHNLVTAREAAEAAYLTFDVLEQLTGRETGD